MEVDDEPVVEVPEENPDSDYSDVHRKFLQTIASYGVLEKDRALEILSGLLEIVQEGRSSNVDQKLKNTVEEINAKITQYHQNIIEVHYDNFKIDYLVFANIVENPINKFQNSYTVNERNYFRSLLKAIASDDEHCIDPVFALNLSSEITDRNLTKNRAEILISKWSNFGYFASKEDREKIYLGPKGIVEFGANLKVLYPDSVKKCPVCEEIIFYGLRCNKENNDCTAIYHRKCVIERLKRFDDCSSCKKTWATKP